MDLFSDRGNLFDEQHDGAGVPAGFPERRVSDGGVTGAGTAFWVTATAKTGEAVVLMATRRRQARMFRSPDPAVALLYYLGVRRVEIDLSRWQPEGPRLFAPRRPDAAARMQRAHAAARGG